MASVEEQFESPPPSPSPLLSPPVDPRTPSPEPVEFSSHFAQPPSFWEPYIPISTSKPLAPVINVDDICEQFNLPFNLFALEEEDRMGVAYAFETHAIMAGETSLVERRYRQKLIVARTLELQFQRAQRQMKKLSVELDLTVIAALKKVASVTVPSKRDAPGCKQMDLQAYCPDVLRLPDCVQLSRKREIHLGTRTLLTSCTQVSGAQA